MPSGKAPTFGRRQSTFARVSSKKSISIGGHRTSVSLEDPFWDELKRAADQRGLGLSQLIAQIDVERETPNLSSALRLFILQHLKGVRPDDKAPC